MAVILKAPGTLAPGTDLALLGCVPEEVRRAMRTVDPGDRGEPKGEQGRTLRDLMRMGKENLREIWIAATQNPGEEEGGTRLAFAQAGNRATGKWGITVHRQLPSGEVGRPLAELLLEKPCRVEDFQRAADELAARASVCALRMVGFEDSDSESPTPAVFAAARDSNGLWLFARLLVTPFEIGQWGLGDERPAQDNSGD